MTFTTTLPTTPGFYAWKPSEESQICGALVVRDSDGKLSCTVTGIWGNWLRDPTERGGLWSRLVPADEIEKAWNESRAKRVMEGLE